MTAQTQQEFLRAAARELGLTQSQLAARMCAPWATFQKWLAPAGSLQGREMPQIAWQLVREILAHEELKNNWEQRLLHKQVAVPVEVLNLFDFMAVAFVPMTGQQEQIKISLDLAKNAIEKISPPNGCYNNHMDKQ